MFKRIKSLFNNNNSESKRSPDKLADDNQEEVNGVFFSEGSEKEYEDFKKEESGMDKWYSRLKNL